MTLSNKPNPCRNSNMTSWKKQGERSKEDAEKAELVVLPTGKKEELKVNSETHAKIILSNETIKQLIDYARKDEWSFISESFDDIITKLLRQVQRKQSRDDN